MNDSQMNVPKRFLVTGGAGFIGSAVIRYLINETDHIVFNLDKLTYAGNLESLSDVAEHENYQFGQIDICDQQDIARIYSEFRPDVVMHLAAESHVDRSIDGPAEFIQSNIIGTYNMLEEGRKYWRSLDENGQQKFRFHHISTDEVYGSLGNEGMFTEDTAYDPSSPYSASKASSDHLVRAWNRTYGLPVVITNCSNNYGPYQFPEKLIPVVILNALKGEALPIYGKGNQIRDWLYVEDHARALYKVVTEGKDGQTYNIGGHNEKTNMDVVLTICQILDELVPNHPAGITRYEDLITHVADRPGHDLRYAIDAAKLQNELNWVPEETFETGIRKSVKWYLENEQWIEHVSSGEYQNWMDNNYTKRAVK